MGVNSFRDRNGLQMKGPSQEKGQQFSLIPQVPLEHGSVGGTGQACPQGSTLPEYPVLPGAGPGWGWFAACLADLRSLARDKPLSVNLEQRWLGSGRPAVGLELHTVTKETEQGESVTGK